MLQQTSPLADKVQKSWEIKMFLIGQRSNVLPEHDVKKERGEIIPQIKQKQFLINLYSMCWHKCSCNLKTSKLRFNGGAFQGSVFLPVPSVHVQQGSLRGGGLPNGHQQIRTPCLISNTLSNFLFPLPNWFHHLKTDLRNVRNVRT